MKTQDSTYGGFARREFLIGGGVLLAGALTCARNWELGASRPWQR
jgi:hypothetical protein